MARSKQCHDLSERKGQDTLMLVRPKGRPANEGLSYNGETAESEEENMAGMPLPKVMVASLRMQPVRWRNVEQRATLQ